MFLKPKKVKAEPKFKKVPKVQVTHRHIDQMNREIRESVEKRRKRLS